MSEALAFAIDSALRACVLLALAGVIVIALRKASAAIRHLTWAAALGMSLALPGMTALLPAWQLLPGWNIESAVSANAASARDASAPPVIGRPAGAGAATQHSLTGPQDGSNAGVSADSPHRATTAARIAPQPTAELSRGLSQHVVLWLSVIWPAGSLVLAARLIGAHLLLSRRMRQRSLASDERVVTILQQARAQLAIRRSIEIRIGPGGTVPMVCGIFRPRILLPDDARGWTDERLQAVMLHELAHVRRADAATQWLAHAACVVYWFNPLVWLAAWRMRAERERACDDIVLGAGVTPSAYAQHLLDIAVLETSPRWSGVCALAITRKPHLENRLVAVLSSGLKRTGLSRRLAAAAVAAGGVISAPVAMMQAADEDNSSSAERSTSVPPAPVAGPVAASPEKLPRDGRVWSTAGAGAWELTEDNTRLDVTQAVIHGADVLSSGILRWPEKNGRPTLRHEFGIAADAFANREPWMLAMTPGETILWIAAGELTSPPETRGDEPRALQWIRAIDFGDPAAVRDSIWSGGRAPLPEAIRNTFAERFALPAKSDPTVEPQVRSASALIDHAWILQGTTRAQDGSPLGRVAIQLAIDEEDTPFDFLRSGEDGKFWSSFSPPLSALENGCVITVSAQREPGLEPPAGFAESQIEITPDDIARGLAGVSAERARSSISGVVNAAQGQPFSDALVGVIGPVESASALTTRADSSGRFVLAGVPADSELTLVVESERWERRGSLEGVRLLPDTTYRADLVLAPGRGFDWKLAGAILKIGVENSSPNQTASDVIEAHRVLVANRERLLSLGEEAYRAGHTSLTEVLDRRIEFTEAKLGLARAEGRADDEIALLGDLADALEEILAETRRMHEAGVASEAEVLDAEQELLKIRLRIAQASADAAAPSDQ